MARGAQTNLLALPEEVLYGYIFPKLHFHDLLRLRRVCRNIKIFSDDFIRNNFKSQEREINEKDATFGEFIHRNLATSAIYINNSGPEIFEDPDLPEFLQLYGDKITRLRIRHFSSCMSDSELNFFSALTSLLHLDVKSINPTRHRSPFTYKNVNGVRLRVRCGRTQFPPNFKNLKTLKFNIVQGKKAIDHGYTWDFIQFCNKLEYLKHPPYKSASQFGGPYDCVLAYIEMQQEHFPDKPTLKFYDLEYHKSVGFNSPQFSELTSLCYRRNIKLLNISGNLYESLWPEFLYAHESFTMPVESLQNIQNFVFLKELPNLEKLDIKSSSMCSYQEVWVGRSRFIPDWPKLRFLQITIDSQYLSGNFMSPQQPAQDLLNFIFAEKERTELKELFIKYRDSGDNKADLPVLRALHITTSCKNVTKLWLSNWLGTNRALSKFWRGLPLLEEVVLEECEMLGDVAFVGKWRDDPVFLKLKNLKSLKLKGLHLMPKVTDLIFQLVFRHLKIKQFCLESEEPLKSITIDGIQSLLTGEFNNSVEKFSFNCWALNGVSQEEFRKLKYQFRATYML